MAPAARPITIMPRLGHPSRAAGPVRHAPHPAVAVAHSKVAMPTTTVTAAATTAAVGRRVQRGAANGDDSGGQTNRYFAKHYAHSVQSEHPSL
jgi:hypothetical protein